MPFTHSIQMIFIIQSALTVKRHTFLICCNNLVDVIIMLLITGSEIHITFFNSMSTLGSGSSKRDCDIEQLVKEAFWKNSEADGKKNLWSWETNKMRRLYRRKWEWGSSERERIPLIPSGQSLSFQNLSVSSVGNLKKQTCELSGFFFPLTTASRTGVTYLSLFICRW